MPRFDLPLDELRDYRPDVPEPPDLDAFWQRTLAEARAVPEPVSVEPLVSPLSQVDVTDVSFSGFAGDRIRAWYLRPASSSDDLPTVVEFVGYGGGRGLPHEHLRWAAAGYAHIVMDTRGQGAVWGGGGGTPDPHGSGPAVPGFLTRGIESPDTSYYRRLYTDAVRCVDAVMDLPGVDPGRVAVAGASQGGGTALAAAALHGRVAAALVDVPFACHFRRALEVSASSPYTEVVQYLAVHGERTEQVLRTLSYVDGVHLARRAQCPGLFSTALLDTVCPPSTVFAAYNHYAGHKEMTVYEYNGHEGGGAARWPVHARFLADVLAPR